MAEGTDFSLRHIHRTDRACIGTDTELFFVGGDDPDLLEPARKRCRRCPIVAGCLLYALTHDVDGIWGGGPCRGWSAGAVRDPPTDPGRPGPEPTRDRRLPRHAPHEHRSASNYMTLTRPSDPVVSTCPTCGWSTHPAREGHARNALRRHSCPAHLARTERSARHQERLDSIDRTPQPCRHPIARHQHGTRAAYVADRCRCQECSNANTTYEQRRVRAHAYGRWTATFVDAEPARRHVNTLRAAGLGRRRVAALAGVSTGALGRLLYGHAGGPPSPRISTTTADHLLAVPAPALAAFAPGALVNAVGTRRRIQALAWVGWSIPQLATRAGIDRQSLHRAIRHDQVTAATATAIRDLYDELWNVAPTPLDRHASAAITRTRNRARAEGWHPPMAWDDIDDANETPTATTTNKLSRTEYCIDTTAELLTLGVGPDEIARRLNVQPASLQRVLHRAGRGDLASQLIRTIRRTA